MKLHKALIALVLSAAALAQTASEKVDLTATSGQTVQFNDGIGSGMRRFEYKIAGGPASASIVLKGCMRGGTCDTLETSTATTSSTRQISGVYDWFTVAPTFTGGSSPSVQVFYTALPRGADAAGSTGGLAQQVQGTAATGAAPVGNPVVMGGVFNSATVQPLATSSTGVLVLGNSFGTTDAMSNTSNRANWDNGSAGGPLLTYPVVFNGSTVDRQFYCPNTTSVSVAATTTQIVPLSGSTKVRVCGFILSGNATAGSFEVVYGTGANCGTGTTSFGIYNVLGATAAPVTYAGGATAALTTPAAQAVCVRATTTTVTGTLIWGQW